MAMSVSDFLHWGDVSPAPAFSTVKVEFIRLKKWMVSFSRKKILSGRKANI